MMISELPEHALLQRYHAQGDYTDCFAIDVPQSVSHAAFVEAFYTTAVFKLERALLSLLVSRPSRDAEARELAAGQREQFSAWSVEARAPGQLLMCDFAGSTRSWLMAVEQGQGTRLYFGSAVVRKRQGGAFRALQGFHKLYSRILLRAAASRALRAG
ncbi:hypothetical protein ABT364_00370 [Massilia sp. SR12]